MARKESGDQWKSHVCTHPDDPPQTHISIPTYFFSLPSLFFSHLHCRISSLPTSSLPLSGLHAGLAQVASRRDHKAKYRPFPFLLHGRPLTRGPFRLSCVECSYHSLLDVFAPPPFQHTRSVARSFFLLTPLLRRRILRARRLLTYAASPSGCLTWFPSLTSRLRCSPIERCSPYTPRVHKKSEDGRGQTSTHRVHALHRRRGSLSLSLSLSTLARQRGPRSRRTSACASLLRLRSLCSRQTPENGHTRSDLTPESLRTRQWAQRVVLVCLAMAFE